MTQRLGTLVFGGVLLDRSMHITFGRAVALPGIELKAGTYIFEMASAAGSHDPPCIYMCADDSALINRY